MSFFHLLGKCVFLSDIYTQNYTQNYTQSYNQPIYIYELHMNKLDVHSP